MEKRYPYPLMELLDTKGRIALFSVATVLMSINMVTLKWLYGRVNGFGRAEKSTSQAGDVKKGDFHSKRTR
jgi:hypothetical protein